METKKNPEADLENKRGLYFLVGLVLVLAIVLVAFEWKTYEKGTSSLGELKVEEIEDEMIPITQQKPPPPPPPPPPQEILEIVEDDEEIENEVEIDDSEADMETEIFEQPEEVIEEPEIFTVVEDMPVFPGCEDAANKEECTQNKIFAYIQKNTDYPSMAKDAGISGTVYIRFLVDENGDVRDAEVLRGVSGGKSLDEEALRVVKSLPKMKPGKQRGQAVRVQYNVPVRFNLRN